MKRMLAAIAVVLGLCSPVLGWQTVQAATPGQDACLYSGDPARVAGALAVIEAEVVGSKTPPGDPRTVLFPEVNVLRVLAGSLPGDHFVLRVAVEPFPGPCDFALEAPRYLLIGIERPGTNPDWAFETSTQLVLWAGAERSGSAYEQALSELDDASPTAPHAGTGTIVLTQAEPEMPWGSIVMVALLLMSFAGGTVAIVRSMRRRR